MDLVIALENIGGEALVWLRNGFSAPCLHFVVDKLKEGSIAEAFACLRNGFSAPYPHFVVDKLKEGSAEAFAWLRNVFSAPLPFEVDKLMKEGSNIAEALHFVVDKLMKEGAITIEHFGEVALAWLGKAFRVALPCMKAVLVIVLVVYFCRIFWSVCFGGVKMMRAPGMPCIRIPRALFNASPRTYFSIQRNISGVLSFRKKGT